MKKNNKKIIFAIIVIIILIFAVGKIFFKQEKTDFTIESVQKGTIVQEVSESGTVEKGENVNLSFKNSGKIESVYVKMGDEVTAGQNLAKLEISQLLLQLEQAEASADAQRARLSELYKGASSGLDSLYGTTPTVLNQAYNLADNAVRQQIAALFLYRVEAAVPYFELTYKNCNSQAAADAASQRKIVEDNLNLWSAELINLNTNPLSLDSVLEKAEDYLKSAQDLFNSLNNTLATDCKLTPAETTAVNTYKAVVSAAITSLNTAMASVSTQIKSIDDQKQAVKNYTSNQESINYQEALVLQAEAAVSLLQDQIRDSVLKSPVDGQIAQINKRAGESVQLLSPFVVLIPKSPFQLAANIYEEDIVKVEIGNPVEIKLTAFPDQTFEGKVVSIDPASNLINGVVYFGIKVDFQNPPANTRPGMSADIIIKTAQKENVLVIPDFAIEKKDGKMFVKIIKDKKTQDREITIGLEGGNNTVEVVSGLQEGERIAVQK